MSFARLPFQVVGSLLGGMLGPRFDRRRMLLVTYVFSALTSGGLAIKAAMVHPSVATLRGTVLQNAVSDAFRSRISGIQMAVVEGGPRLGDLESGVVASAVFAQFAVVSGGAACVAVAALLALALPGFRGYLAARDRKPADG